MIRKLVFTIAIMLKLQSAVALVGSEQLIIQKIEKSPIKNSKAASDGSIQVETFAWPQFSMSAANVSQIPNEDVLSSNANSRNSKSCEVQPTTPSTEDPLATCTIPK